MRQLWKEAKIGEKLKTVLPHGPDLLEETKIRAAE